MRVRVLSIFHFALEKSSKPFAIVSTGVKTYKQLRAKMKSHVLQTDSELEDLLTNPAIIRNRLKVFYARKNALVFLEIQKEFGSFDNYLWGFIEGKPKINRPKNLENIPTKTAISDALSKDLKKRGMSFVGTTIMYAFMQAVGMVNDHMEDCFLCNSP